VQTNTVAQQNQTTEMLLHYQASRHVNPIINSYSSARYLRNLAPA